ncbi:MAG: hypothetical protein MRY64_16460 [Hyphomonadaceae bacterium]|nr:hypothetical protein [Hyphomonadaceae bacterium]
MGKIVCAVGTTHTPGLLGWFEDAPEDQQKAAKDAFQRQRDAIAESGANVMIIIGNDHLLNWPINNTPEFTVGIGDMHTGPADWYDEWMSQTEKYHVPGAPGLARHLVNGASDLGLSLAYLRDMKFDDAVSIPVKWLNPDAAIPIIPISMNCTVPPVPSPRRAYDVGLMLRELVASYAEDVKVVLVASGGLSHEPGGPRYFHIDEEFDRFFLDTLASGDHEKMLRECTLERMEAAGTGGTAELLAWFTVLAATQGPAEVLDYVKSYAWRCASGWVIWPTMADH